MGKKPMVWLIKQRKRKKKAMVWVENKNFRF